VRAGSLAIPPIGGMEKMRTFSCGFVLAVCLALAGAVDAPLAGEPFQTCIYVFDGNVAEPDSDQDLTCSTIADNMPDEDPANNDVGIGERACASDQCDDDRACFCESMGAAPSDFNHYFEFTVQCRDAGEQCSTKVDLDRLEFLTRMAAAGRSGRIHVFKNNDGFVGWEEIDVVDVDSTTASTKTVDLSDVDPACKVAFRLVPEDNVTPTVNLVFRGEVDDLEVFGNCVDADSLESGPHHAGTASLRAAFGQSVQCSATNVTDWPITIDSLAIYKKAGNTAASQSFVVVPPHGTKTLRGDFSSHEEYHCEASYTVNADDLMTLSGNGAASNDSGALKLRIEVITSNNSQAGAAP
jgi:hypothetical protein